MKIGETVGHYRIVEEIGKGGMGEVYLAQDTKLNRKAAIKFLNEKLGKDAEKLNRFVQEAQATSALNHPNILTVYGIDSFEDKHYIATEYIEGKTLRKVISGKESIQLNRILKIAIQVAEALSAAHDAGIAHRDIKPENIMVRKDGYVKVLDFGLAKLTEKNKTGDSISLEGETKALVKTNPGVVMGTANYMSPEQAQGKETDGRTDIWSLGVILYELLAGRVPFEGKTVNHTIVSILETEPKLLEDVPDELQRIVKKTLSKDKDTRYQTAKDLLIDLKNLRRDLDIQGELERSIIPNRDFEAVVGETVSVSGSMGETAAASGAMSTQHLTNTSSLEYAVTQAKSHKLATGVIALLLVGIVSAASYFAFFSGKSDQIESIAVMPFVNEGSNADVEYLSDGMTESLINDLSNVPNLAVKARSTVFFYKGKEVSAKKLGEELNVQAVLFGRFAQRGDDITISLELVDTKTQDLLWGERFDRKVKDLVSLQSELAKKVAGKISSKLSGEDEKKVTKSYTDSPEAYQAYLKGRFYWNQRTGDGFKKGIDYFQQAIEIDPNYALAWSGLADSYVLLPEYSSTPPKEFLPKAKEAASKAVELDPSLAEAQTSMAYVEHTYEWKFAEAAERYKKAIELNPNYSTAYQWYSELLLQQRRFSEARSTAKKAVDLDPLSLIKNTDLGVTYFFAAQYPEAEAQFRKVLEIQSVFPVANRQLARSIAAQGRIDEALAECDRAVEAGGEIFKYCKGLVYSVAGDKTNAERYTSDYTGLEGRQVYDLANTYALLGNKERALEGVKELIEARSVFVLYMNAEPAFDRFRNDTDFVDLMKQVGLESK